MDLFTQNQDPAHMPLAERLRPKSLDEFVGQTRALRDSGVLRLLENRGRLPNLILWGPPGTGKTTFARLLAQHSEAECISVNAVDTGAKQLRELGEAARLRRLQWSKGTILFVDEIHRLNKGQQDVLLPFTERGDFVLVGATTENPSYEMNAALLSRSRVLVFERLTEADLGTLLGRACSELGRESNSWLTPEAQRETLRISDGDGRRLLNLLETLAESTGAGSEPLKVEDLAQLIPNQPLYYDKNADDHYDCISAFIKSVRGSNPDGAVYYLARMLEGGEDPVFLARRLVILASEDVGNADPRALSVAVAGLQAVELVGMPEAAISLAQVTTYLASAPKSNRSYMALNKAKEIVQQTGRLPVPLALRSSKTALNKAQGYGKGYQYSHEGERGYIEQDFLPEKIKEETFYEPVERGFEKNIRAYLDWVRGRGSTQD